MTGYEAIQNCSEDQMVEFLYRFSNDVIDHFSKFQMPDRENIRKFIESEIPINHEEE